MEPIDFSSGTYSAVRPDQQSLKHLKEWMDAVGIPNPVALHALHATTLYSQKPVITEAQKDRTFYAQPDGFRIMRHRNDQTDALALVLDSPALQARHQEFINAGGVHDYDSFIPHVSLTYDIGDFDWRSLELPKFGLIFANEYVRPLKPPPTD